MPNIKHVGLAVAAAALALTVTACGDDTDGDAEAAAESTAIAVEHRFGTVELDEVPERIVALDTQWVDALVALGVQPVGYAKAFGSDRYPWQGELDGDAEGIDVSIEELPMEQIASLDPDLIVGGYAQRDEAVHRRLADIAPAIGPIEADQVDAWQDIVTAAGALLDREDEAAALIEDVQGQVQVAAEAHPGLAGKTFTLSQYIKGDGIYVVADEADGSSRFFQDLGMVMNPAMLEELAGQGTRPKLSPERVDVLGADLVVFYSALDRAALEVELPGFTELPSVRSGAMALVDFATVVGLNTPSPLSIPYELEQLEEQLTAAEG
jgi:iron complex transport system substrate-binding protein